MLIQLQVVDARIHGNVNDRLFQPPALPGVQGVQVCPQHADGAMGPGAKGQGLYRLRVLARGKLETRVPFSPERADADWRLSQWVKTDLGGPGADLTLAQAIPAIEEVVLRQNKEDNGKFLDIVVPGFEPCYTNRFPPW